MPSVAQTWPPGTPSSLAFANGIEEAAVGDRERAAFAVDFRHVHERRGMGDSPPLRRERHEGMH
jgi:hypothetical protein